MTEYILDSNIIIYAIQPDKALLRKRIGVPDLYLSTITKLEVLGYHRIQEEELLLLRRLIDNYRILPVSESIIEQAIDLRQQKSMSVGDALIAATALTHHLVLLTHNTRDFAWIEELEVENPLP